MEARQFAASGAGRMIRQAARLSLAQVAAELGVNASTVFRWESGQLPTGERAIAYHELMRRLSVAGASPVKPRRKVAAWSERLVYRVDEVAELLGCGKNTIYDAIARDELPGVLRLGRRVLISKAALHEALGLTAATTDSSQENGAAGNGAATERGSHEIHGEHKGQARR